MIVPSQCFQQRMLSNLDFFVFLLLWVRLNIFFSCLRIISFCVHRSSTFYWVVGFPLPPFLEALSLLGLLPLFMWYGLQISLPTLSFVVWLIGILICDLIICLISSRIRHSSHFSGFWGAIIIYGLILNVYSIHLALEKSH